MNTNENRKQKAIEDDDYDEDETISERLIGLTEMFPESLRRGCCHVAGYATSATKASFWLFRNAIWVATSTAVVLVLPVLFESERANLHEEQLQQQRQILLGPNAAVSGSSGAGGNLLPGMGMVPPTPPARS